MEFKVNDFLTLKLEDDKTFIYIKGKKFIQCMRLFIQIPPQKSSLYEEVESIDEATESISQTDIEEFIGIDNHTISKRYRDIAESLSIEI